MYATNPLDTSRARGKLSIMITMASTSYGPYGHVLFGQVVYGKPALCTIEQLATQNPMLRINITGTNEPPRSLLSR